MSDENVQIGWTDDDKKRIKRNSFWGKTFERFIEGCKSSKIDEIHLKYCIQEGATPLSLPWMMNLMGIDPGFAGFSPLYCVEVLYLGQKKGKTLYDKYEIYSEKQLLRYRGPQDLRRLVEIIGEEIYQNTHILTFCKEVKTEPDSKHT